MVVDYGLIFGCGALIESVRRDGNEFFKISNDTNWKWGRIFREPFRIFGGSLWGAQKLLLRASNRDQCDGSYNCCSAVSYNIHYLVSWELLQHGQIQLPSWLLSRRQADHDENGGA